MSDSDPKVVWDGKVEAQDLRHEDLRSGDLSLCVSAGEVLRFEPEGRVLYKGKPIVDKQLVDGLREVLAGYQVSNSYMVAQLVKALMNDWSELDDADEDSEVVVSATTMMKLRSLLQL